MFSRNADLCSKSGRYQSELGGLIILLHICTFRYIAFFFFYDKLVVVPTKLVQPAG
jgi:hypothetical protein